MCVCVRACVRACVCETEREWKEYTHQVPFCGEFNVNRR